MKYGITKLLNVTNEYTIINNSISQDTIQPIKCQKHIYVDADNGGKNKMLKK